MSLSILVAGLFVAGGITIHNGLKASDGYPCHRPIFSAATLLLLNLFLKSFK